MGLTVNSLPVYDGLTTISNVYVNIRDISTNKEESGKHSMRFNCNYSKDGKIIDRMLLTHDMVIPYNSDVWTKAYNYLKEDLQQRNLTWKDNL